MAALDLVICEMDWRELIIFWSLLDCLLYIIEF